MLRITYVSNDKGVIKNHPDLGEEKKKYAQISLVKRFLLECRKSD